MIRTWVAEVSALYEPEVYRSYYEQLPRHRREKADRIRFTQDKALSVGAWALLCRMLEYYGLPGTKSQDFHQRLYNLSHSGKYVLCSLEDTLSCKEEQIPRLGCDIETVKDMRMKVAERFFCPGELAYIKEQQGASAQAEAFYRYWVLKESFLKATRLGMALDTRSFEIAFDEKHVPVLIHQPEAFLEQFYYREYEAEGIPAKIAVCSTNSGFDELQVSVLNAHDTR